MRRQPSKAQEGEALGEEGVAAAVSLNGGSKTVWTWQKLNLKHLPRPRAQVKSKLEFSLRVQEFIGLVGSDMRLEAIQYARAHLAPWAGLYMKELQQAVATLALTRHTRCQPYRSFFEESRWQALADLFHRDLYSLNSLPRESPLVAHLQAGLSALKTPLSYQVTVDATRATYSGIPLPPSLPLGLG